MSKQSRFTDPSFNERAEILRNYGLCERFIREKERLRITSVSRTKWWKLEQIRQVPPKKHIGTSIVWLLSDLLLWLHHYSS